MTDEEYDKLRRSAPYQIALAAGLAVLEAAQKQRDAEVAELERLYVYEVHD